MRHIQSRENISIYYAKLNYSAFMHVTARLALKLILADLKSQPIFLCIGNTMVSKFRKKFEDV